MSIKTLIEDISNSKQTPLDSIKQFALVMEASPSELFETFNELSFEQQCRFIEKTFEHLPESYLLIAQFLVHQDNISDEGVKYQLNDIAQQNSSERLRAIACLNEKLKNKKAELGNALSKIAQSLQSPLTLKQQIVELEKKLASLRQQHIEQSPDLFAINDLEEQIAKIQGELDRLTSYNFTERESHLRRLKEQIAAKESKKVQLEAEIESRQLQVQKLNEEIKGRQKMSTELQSLKEQLNQQQDAIEQSKKNVADAENRFKEAKENADKITKETDIKKKELERETAHLKSKAQVAFAELNRFKTLLDRVKNFGSRLDNVPKDTGARLLSEIEEIKMLLDDKNENGLKNRILRISGQLQTVDEVEKIMKNDRI